MCLIMVVLPSPRIYNATGGYQKYSHTVLSLEYSSCLVCLVRRYVHAHVLHMTSHQIYLSNPPKNIPVPAQVHLPVNVQLPEPTVALSRDRLCNNMNCLSVVRGTVDCENCIVFGCSIILPRELYTINVHVCKLNPGGSLDIIWLFITVC